MQEKDSFRKIIHIDMDAFFAAVEQLDFPQYRGKPIAVGGGGKRGVVAAASYEARKYGVRSAMSNVVALQKCSQLVFVKHRFDRYKELSKQIMQILKRYTDLVEPLSIDEAFLDVTQNKMGWTSATLIAEEIRKTIKEETGLTASAGVSYNKFLAKTASDVNKPDGLFVIPPSKAIAFLEQLPIERFYGVGKVTAKKMLQLKILNGADLKEKNQEFLSSHFGKQGVYYYQIVRGIDNRLVTTFRERKSFGMERTFREDVVNQSVLCEGLEEIAKALFRKAESKKSLGRTLTLKVKYSDFQQLTRSKTEEEKIKSETEMLQLARALLNLVPLNKGIRLLGLSFSNIKEQEQKKPLYLQLTLDFE